MDVVLECDTNSFVHEKPGEFYFIQMKNLAFKKHNLKNEDKPQTIQLHTQLKKMGKIFE